MALRKLALALLLAPTLAAAGGTAKLTAIDNNGRPFSATVEFADMGRIRAASPQRPEGYLLARDKKIYNITRVNGQQVVMEAADLMRVAGKLMPSPTAALEEVSAIISLKPTKRRETVAGITGTVHELVYEDGRKNRRTEELVLAKNPTASEFTTAAIHLGKTLATLAGTVIPPGADDLVARIQADGQGLLRFGDRFRLNSIDSNTPASSRFEMPQGSFQIPDLRGLIPGLGGRQ